MRKALVTKRREEVSFNTASGKYYCNANRYLSFMSKAHYVSIPQAVSTIAIMTTVELKKFFV